MTIGDRIKKRRKELDMTVEELAIKLNKNRATIYRYESDEIENLSINVLGPLAKVLNTTPAYLMGWDCTTDTIKSDDKIDLLINNFNKLNDTGIEEAIKRVAELTYIPIYCKE